MGNVTGNVGRRNVAFLPGLVALVLVFALQLANFPLLGGIGLHVFDTYQRLEPRTYKAVPVRIVDIDEESIRRYGQWPWPRTLIAQLTQSLNDYGAAVVAFDVVFSEPDRTSPPQLAATLRAQPSSRQLADALARLPDNDVEFARTLSGMSAVSGLFLTRDPTRVQAEPKTGFGWSGSEPLASLSSFSNAILPLPAIKEASAGLGVLTLQGDRDGIVRRAPLLARQGTQVLPALSLEALRVAQGAGSILVKTSTGSGNLSGGGDATVDSIKVGQITVPTNGAGEFWLWYTSPHANRVVPAWKVLSGVLSQADKERSFAGQIVFVGTGAIGLRDLISTPLQDRELGVMVHAQAAEQMILGRFLTRPDWAEGLERSLVLGMGLILVVLLPSLGAARGAAVGIAFASIALGGSWLAFHREQSLLDPTYPLLAVLAVFLSQTVSTYYLEERRRRYIHRAFDRYLSPELVKRIAADPRQLELGGEERQMTVLFCDVRGFSRIAETLSPHDIIQFLIGFLTPMCEVLLGRRATIDKFIGDAILAFWNAPLDDPQQYENAARAALGMVERLEELNAEIPSEGKPWPSEVKIGIGLNAGPCCVGNMGSVQRLSYSLIGDTVNLASRIEGLTKQYGVTIAIGSTLATEIPGFAVVEIDRVRVVGRDTPETIFALVGDETVAADPAFAKLAGNYHEMLAAYRAGDWSAAHRRLDAVTEEAACFGLDGVNGLYRRRIAKLLADPPPAGWDGVFVATEK